MPKFSSQFQKLLALLLIILSVNSCEPGCVEAYEFDSETHYVNSKPKNEGIYGTYNDATGGEIAGWTNTNLRTNGEGLILSVSGGWTAWDDASNPDELNDLPACNICFKKKDFDGSDIENCICGADQNPVPEKDTFGNPLNVDCSDPAIQNNPNLCTCTTQYGAAENPGDVYSITTNYQNKDESLKIPDEQFACRYSKGEGLYIGLFGKLGYTIPTRVYHVYPTQEICDIPRNANGECKGNDGIDQTKYIYRSPNNLIFVKDDLAGNNGTDASPQDDIYHNLGEYIKLIINDRYYSDNYGGYNVEFLGGFLRAEDSSLLEYIIRVIEDALLGKVDENGNRDGGVVKFMYNSIIQDSVFILILQTALILYVVVFGIFVIAGLIQITRKELISRVLKISLIALFTTEASWHFYNQLVVGLFKNSMDFLITMFMTMSDNTVDPSSIVMTSQLDRASSASHATRFSYVDVMIRKLFSVAASKKILGLFFSDLFGFIYMIVIYALIFGFLGVMVFAALMYVKMLVGIVLLLALGPIFIIMTLFSKTLPIFKRWLAILASQSMQIMALFLIVYLFAVIIDKGFNELLYYRSCTESIDFKIFHIDFYKAQIYRSMGDWLMMFIKVGSMIFLLYMIIQQIPSFIGRLVIVSGQKADVSPSFFAETRAYSTQLAKDLFGKMRGITTTAWDKKGFSATGTVGRTTGALGGGIGDLMSGTARSFGAENTANAIGKYNPTALYNGHQLDKLIRQKQKANQGNNSKIRQEVIAEARKRGFGDDETIKRLNKQLSINPIRAAIKDEYKKLKKEGFKGLFDDKELRAELEKRLGANKDLDKSKISEVLSDQNLVLDSSTAAKIAVTDDDLANKYREFDADKRDHYKNLWKFLGGYSGYSKSEYKDALNENFDVKLRQQRRNENKEYKRGVKESLYDTYNRYSPTRRSYRSAVDELENTIGKATGAMKDHDKYAEETTKAWNDLKAQQDEVAKREALEGYMRKLEHDKNQYQKNKSELDAELNKIQGQMDINNTTKEKERADSLSKTLKKYEVSKQKIDLWKKKSDIELKIKQLNDDPQKNSEEIKKLEKQSADIDSQIETIDKNINIDNDNTN